MLPYPSGRRQISEQSDTALDIALCCAVTVKVLSPQLLGDARVQSDSFSVPDNPTLATFSEKVVMECLLKLKHHDTLQYGY